MDIRQATREDKQSIIDTASVLYLDIPDFVWNKDEYVDKQIERGEYFIAEEESEVVGIISFRDRRGKLYIETLAIPKKSQANGFGRKMLEFAKLYAREQGFKTLRACAFHEYGTKEFYVNHGFSLLDDSKQYGGRRFYRFEAKL